MIPVVFVSSALNISKRQSIMRLFQEYPETDESNSSCIIVSTSHLIGAGIILSRAYQLVITDPKYSSYPEAQVEKGISRIGQLNSMTAHFLVCYNIDVERKRKEQHKQRENMAIAIIKKQK